MSENATHQKVITHRCQNNHLILTPLVSFIIMTSIPSDIKLPPSDVKQTIDKTVGYVIKNGKSFEERLLKNNKMINSLLLNQIMNIFLIINGN